jgi:hypothetical protein
MQLQCAQNLTQIPISQATPIIGEQYNETN